MSEGVEYSLARRELYQYDINDMVFHETAGSLTLECTCRPPHQFKLKTETVTDKAAWIEARDHMRESHKKSPQYRVLLSAARAEVPHHDLTDGGASAEWSPELLTRREIHERVDSMLDVLDSLDETSKYFEAQEAKEKKAT